MEDSNWGKRVELAVAYRALDKYGFNEGVTNHLTALAPAKDGDGQVMLIVPLLCHWSEVTPKGLIGLDVDTLEVVEGSGTVDPSAPLIHKAVYKARPESKSVMHTHPTYSSALSCLKDQQIKMMHQNSTMFLHNVVYDDHFGGFISDDNAECQRIIQLLGDKDVLLMGNHGLLTVATTVAEAFHLHYYFEQAAKVQVLAYQTGREIRLIEDTVAEAAYRQAQTAKTAGAEAQMRAMESIFNHDEGFSALL